MTTTEIKARLYELQGHACNGRLTVHPDGRRAPGDHACAGCAEIGWLQHLLREAAIAMTIDEHLAIVPLHRKEGRTSSPVEHADLEAWQAERADLLAERDRLRIENKRLQIIVDRVTPCEECPECVESHSPNELSASC